MTMKPLALLAIAGVVAAGCLGDAPAAGADGAQEDLAAAATLAWAADGTSYTFWTGSCIPICTVALVGYDHGKFRLPRNATDLVLEASWTPATPLDQEVDLRVLKGEREVAAVVGASPLTVPLGALPAGAYTVAVFPAIAAGYHEIDMTWRVAGTLEPETGGASEGSS